MSRVLWTGALPGDLITRISERGDDELLTSTLTLGEVLTQPISFGDRAWADRYERLLSSPGITLLAFDRPAARVYAHLRQDRSIKARPTQSSAPAPLPPFISLLLSIAR